MTNSPDAPASDHPSRRTTDKEKMDDQQFWRALKRNDNRRSAATPAPESGLTDLSQVSEDEREQRRLALRSMLTANEARQRQQQRARLPVLTPGVRVGVRSGEFHRCEGSVVDADFIQSRVLLELDDNRGKHWIEFRNLTPAREILDKRTQTANHQSQRDAGPDGTSPS